MTPRQMSLFTTFATVARSMSFSLAAKTLCLTQSAVSQRIKALEKSLEFPLFVRLTRQLKLTEEGVRLLSVVQQALQHIEDEVQEVKNQELRGELHIGASPTFAQKWLLPRLPAFQQRYPSLNLRIHANANQVNFQTEPVHIAIYYNKQPQPGLYCQRLFEEWLLPVCHPEMAPTLAQASTPRSLDKACFIHCTESIDSLSPALEWTHWLTQHDWLVNAAHQQIVFNHADMTLLAAQSGMGIAMGRWALVLPALRTGQLAAPWPAMASGYGYDLICPNGQETRPPLHAFSEWLRQEAANHPAPAVN